MSEARILAAFWQPKAKRFCELTAEEVRDRSGRDISCPEFRSLVQRRVIRWTTIASDSQVKVYRLYPEGERRVSAMVVMGTLPRLTKLTAIPPDERRHINTEGRQG